MARDENSLSSFGAILNRARGVNHARAATEREAMTRPVSSKDGRRAKATGRTAQLNVRVKPELREAFLRWCVDNDETVVSGFERLVMEATGETL